MSDLISSVTDALPALKSALDLFRTAVGAARDTIDLLPDAQEKQAAGRALEEAVAASKIAEAQLAQALGYELCRCQFPPTPMLQIGHRVPREWPRKVEQIYECPLCNQNTAGPFAFTRKVSD